MVATGKRIYRAPLVAISLVALAASTSAFQPTPRALDKPSALAALGDPNDWAHIASQIHHHDISSWDALLSTLQATTVEGVLKPAHGHSQSMFGPIDPILASGKSLAPDLKALGISPSDPVAIDQLPEALQSLIRKGDKVVDSSHFEAVSRSLPGPSETHGIFPRSRTDIPEANDAIKLAQGKHIAKFNNILEKLPYLALGYGILEFGVLRGDVDVSKEDIEDYRAEVDAETIAVGGVRLGVFFVLSLLATIFIDGNIS